MLIAVLLLTPPFMPVCLNHLRHHIQYLAQIPNGPMGLLDEVKNNTHHYISVIADAADSQLAMLTTTGSVPADVYDNLQETVREGVEERGRRGLLPSPPRPSSSSTIA